MVFGQLGAAALVAVLLALAVSGAALYGRGCRSRALARWGLLAAGAARVDLSPAQRRLRRVLAVGAVVLALVALARPCSRDPVPEYRPAHDVLFVVDGSASMRATDVLPSRGKRAQEWVLQVAARLPSCRMGLVTFAGRAWEECPLTSDQRAFAQWLEDLTPDDRTPTGSDVESALRVAAAALGRRSGGILVLVSDGEFHGSDPRTMADDLAAAGVHVLAVGVGQAREAPVPKPNEEGYLSDPRSGRTAMTAADPRRLRRLARRAGGLFIDASVPGAGVDTAERWIRGLPARGVRVQPRRQEYGPLLLLPAVGLLAASLLVDERRRRESARPRRPASAAGGRGAPWPVGRSSLVLLPALVFALRAEEWSVSSLRLDLIEAPPGDRPRCQYNLALALQQASRAADAEELYRHVLRAPGSGDLLRARALNNLAAIRMGQARRLTPDDPGAAVSLLRTAAAELTEAGRLFPGLQPVAPNLAEAETLLEEARVALALAAAAARRPETPPGDGGLPPRRETGPTESRSGTPGDIGAATASLLPASESPTAAGLLERLCRDAGSARDLQRRLRGREAAGTASPGLPW
ncbi:MAG: VWA domain-containing protein [Lentisphaeria bacterium]|nr:VWA domain-containing protein [Lentisphaeria bacterium]